MFTTFFESVRIGHFFQIPKGNTWYLKISNRKAAYHDNDGSNCEVSFRPDQVVCIDSELIIKAAISEVKDEY